MKSVTSSLLLTAWYVFALGIPSASAQAVKPMAPDANPTFEVATIKPNDSGFPMMRGLKQDGRQFTTINTSLVDLIAFAYVVQKKQIVGGPDWIGKERFDMVGQSSGEEGAPSLTQWRVMVQKLLAERFGLKFHNGQAEMPAFVLTTLKSDKLTPTKTESTLPVTAIEPAPGGWTITLKNASSRALTAYLQMVVLDRPVVDQTGLTSHYDFQITFLPDESQFSGHPPPTRKPENGEMAAPLFEAIQTQLGLKLEARKSMVETINIDHAEHPSAN